MCDEFSNWDDLNRLWRDGGDRVSTRDIERRERAQRRLMTWLAIGEGGALTLCFVAAMWIAMQTAYVAMTAISLVFFGVCAWLQHRMRREPLPAGGDDLLTALAGNIAREDWNLAQLGVGRAVTLLTMAAISMVAFDHLRHYASTPPGRIAALLAIAAIVLGILAWNLALTVLARRRRRGLEAIVAQLQGTP
ncbi:MAG TPA: hypothetical protein VMF52_16855 [Steroidobacteraceae bacterium]|nr:hypothetical protein [Steroidobacteraceae bacterium]